LLDRELTLDPLFSPTTQFSKIKSRRPKGEKLKLSSKTFFATPVFLNRKKPEFFTGLLTCCQLKKRFLFGSDSRRIWAAFTKTRAFYTDLLGLSTKKSFFPRALEPKAPLGPDRRAAAEPRNDHTNGLATAVTEP
jgi:hypothetical protein